MFVVTSNALSLLSVKRHCFARFARRADLGMVEWKSTTNVAAIPYRLLIRTFGADDEGYRSPVD